MPTGEIYVGADCECVLELGILTRAFCQGVFKFVATMVNNLCYSFGESPAGENHQIGHLVAPLFATMDKVVVTLAPQTPPTMGEPFVEDLEFR